MPALITVAICTRDRPSQLRRCLGSLQPQMDEQNELLVVDSAPTATETRLIAAAAGARYVVAPRPGLNVARNLARRSAKGSIIAFVDDDVVAAPTWLETLRVAFEDASVACVTGRVLPLELRTAEQRYFEQRYSFDRGAEPIRFTASDDRPWFPVHPWHLGTGCNMAFRRQVFDRIGPFDEALDAGTPSGGGGDIDTFRRLLRAGFAAAYDPAALVYHEHRESKTENLRQFWAYGKAFTALLTKSMIVERDMEHVARQLAIHRLQLQGQRIARWLFRRNRFPLRLILAETMGNLAGPAAYLYSLYSIQHAKHEGLPGVQFDDGLPATLEVEDSELSA